MKRVDIIRGWARTVITTLCAAADGESDVDFVLYMFRANFPHLVEMIGLTSRRADIIGIVKAAVKYTPEVSHVYTDEIFGKEWAHFVLDYKED